jgi:hypothetical protein
MYCPLCHSNNGAKFPTEMVIHFSGIQQVDNPAVLAFTTVSICFNCGFSGFTTPEAQLRKLQNGGAAAAA